MGLLLWDQRDYEELLIINTQGIVLASTFNAHEGKSALNIDYFLKGMGSTYIQQVFLSPITAKLTMVVATPIKDANLRVIGVLAARLNLNNFFRLIGDQIGLGITGETLVAHKLDDKVVSVAPTRPDANTALNRTVKVGADIPKPFGVVKAMRHKMLLMLISIFLAVLIFSALISKTLVAPLKELKETADKISRGELDVKLSISSADEIGDLADSFERMIAAIKYFKEENNDD